MFPYFFSLLHLNSMQIKHAKLNSDLLIIFESIVMKFNDTNRWSPKKWCEQREIHK